MNKIPAVAARIDIIGDNVDVGESTTEFAELAARVIAATARQLVDNAPADVDVGRLIAMLDALQHAKNLCSDAAMLGSTTKKRKASDDRKD